MAGFGGYRPDRLSGFYVHKVFQRRGIATPLCARPESDVGGGRIERDASIAVRPFFEKRGCRVAGKEVVERRGVLRPRYVMEKHK